MNKPIKAKYILLIPLLCFLLMFGNRLRIEWKYKDAELPPLPSNAEYLEYMEARKDEDTVSYEFAIQLRLAEIPHDELYAHFETIVGEWLEKQTVCELKSSDFKIGNTFAVDRGVNQLRFNNVQIDLALTLVGDAMASEKLWNDLMNDLHDFLERDVYGVYKTGIINLSIESANGITVYEDQYSYYIDREQTYRIVHDGTLWPEDESHTLTLAYDYADEIREEIIPKGSVLDNAKAERFVLSHFGIRKNESDLYIRTAVLQSPPDVDKNYTEIIPGFAEELADKLLADKTAAQWLRDQSAKTITVVFAPEWDEALGESVFFFPVE